ncbi:MAG: addiction module protein [Rhodocyclales bacterium]|nr:addiction module protein [Rhodocyclales bacterium]
MRMTVEQIADEALALPSEARALLADRLVESLDPAEDGYIRQLWMREAKRRVDEVRRGEVQTIPAEVAFSEVRQALAR